MEERDRFSLRNRCLRRRRIDRPLPQTRTARENTFPSPKEMPRSLKYVCEPDYGILYMEFFSISLLVIHWHAASTPIRLFFFFPLSNPFNNDGLEVTKNAGSNGPTYQFALLKNGVCIIPRPSPMCTFDYCGGGGNHEVKMHESDHTGTYFFN